MAAQDIVAVSVILLVLGLGLFIATFIGDTVSNELTNIAAVNESSAATTVLESIPNLTARFDYMLLLVFVGMVLGIIILSWFVPAHPIFYVAYLIVLILSVVLSTIMSHVWDVFINQPSFTNELLKFPITNHLLGNLPIYISVVGFVGITVMFAKPYLSEGME